MKAFEPRETDKQETNPQEKKLKWQLISKLKGYVRAEIVSPKEELGNNILKDHKAMSD